MESELIQRISSRVSALSDGELAALHARYLPSQRARDAASFLVDGLYPGQYDLITSPAKKKSVLTPRQVGKTFTLVRYLVRSAILSPSERAVTAYATDTREHAYDLVWRPLLDVLDDVGIDYTPHIVDLDVTVHAPSGDRTVSLFGVDDERKSRRLRGYQYGLFVVDEAQSVPDQVLRRLLEEDISAGLGAWDGTLLLCGTPGPILAGVFYDRTTRSADFGYQLFRWTHDDNCLFPRWSVKGKPVSGWEGLKDEWLEGEKVGRSEAAWRREYLGVWAADESSYCYHLGAANEPKQGCDLSGLPCVLGVDLGWIDQTAFVLLSADRPNRSISVRHFESHTGMGLEALAARIEALVVEHRPVTVVMDSAGAGKIIQESMARQMAERYGLSIRPAKKVDKAVHIAILDNIMREGRFLCPKGKLWDQLISVQKDPITGIEIKTARCDLADATLYASRECYEYIQDPKKEEKPKTEEEMMLDSILRREVHG